MCLKNELQKLKNKNGKSNTWNYYYNGLKIGEELYNLEFNVVSRQDEENHYRLQRLELKKEANTSSGDANKNARILPPYEVFASYNKNTTKLQNNQMESLPPQYSMQQNHNNSQKTSFGY